MKKQSQILHSAAYQLKILTADKKIVPLFVCIFIFMFTDLKELRDFLSGAGVRATPFFFPFMTASPWLYMCMLAGIVPVMSEAPFYRKEQIFLILREGRSRWILGNMLYCLFFCILYTAMMIAISILALAGNLEIGTEWGKVWTTLAVTNASSEIAFSVPVSQYVIFSYTPVQALLLAALLNIQVNVFYSFFLWTLNLTAGRLVSIAAACASMCLITRIAYLPSFVWYLCPAAWADLGSLSSSGFGRYSVGASLIYLAVLDGGFGIAAYVTAMKADPGK